MSKFHPLAVSKVERETRDAIAITFDVPERLRDQFRFEPGQHLTLRTAIGGEDIRRSYSICAPMGGPLRIAVKRSPGGVFSMWANEALREQGRSVSFEEINYTGAGFFVRLTRAANLPALDRSGVIGDVEAALPDGAALSVLLFVVHGFAEELEVGAYGDWPEDISGFRCHYIRWRQLDHETRIAEPTDVRDVASMWS